MKYTKIILYSVIGLLNLQPLSGQSYRLQSDRYGTGGLSAEWWKASDDQIMSFSLPLTFVYPVSPKARLYAMTTPAFSTLNRGTPIHLKGLSDLKLGGHFLMAGDKMLLTWGLNVPTGHNALSVQEFEVANVMSMSAFNFRVPAMGQGLDAQAGLSSAAQVGDWVLGYGVSYLFKGGFQPYNDAYYKANGLGGIKDKNYTPGSELTLTLGCDFGSVMADVLYTFYSADEFMDNKAFQSGNRLLVQAYWLTKINDRDMVFFVRGRMKEANKTMDPTNLGDALKTDAENKNNNQFIARNDWYFPAGSDARWKLGLEYRLYADNEEKTGGANLFGFGGGLERPMGENVILKLDAKYFIGKLKTGPKDDAVSVDAMGVNVFGGVEIGL